MFGRKAESGATDESVQLGYWGPQASAGEQLLVQSHYSVVSGSQKEGAEIQTPPAFLMMIQKLELLSRRGEPFPVLAEDN